MRDPNPSYSLPLGKREVGEFARKQHNASVLVYYQTYSNVNFQKFNFDLDEKKTDSVNLFDCILHIKSQFESQRYGALTSLSSTGVLCVFCFARYSAMVLSHKQLHKYHGV